MADQLKINFETASCSSGSPSCSTRLSRLRQLITDLTTQVIRDEQTLLMDLIFPDEQFYRDRIEMYLDTIEELKKEVARENLSTYGTTSDV